MLFLWRSPRLWVSLAVSGGTVLWLNLSIMDKEGWSHGRPLCPAKGLLWPSLGENERQKDGEAFVLCLPQKSNSLPHQVHRASIAAPAVAVRDRQSGVKMQREGECVPICSGGQGRQKPQGFRVKHLFLVVAARNLSCPKEGKKKCLT